MHQRRRVAFRVLVCTAVSLMAVATSAQSTNVSNEVLLRRIEELERRLAIAERRDEIDREASAEKAKSAVTVSAGAGGLQVNSADTNFVLKVRGYIQARNAFSYAAGLNWYLNRNVRVYLNYEHTDFEGGTSNQVLQQDESVILTRAQLSF